MTALTVQDLAIVGPVLAADAGHGGCGGCRAGDDGTLICACGVILFELADVANVRPLVTPETRVYRLVVTYPPGSLERGWEPPGWEPEFAAGPPDWEDEEFRWPANRLCLSAATARRRAELFRKYGAEVTIRRSLPVEWPEATR